MDEGAAIRLGEIRLERIAALVGPYGSGKSEIAVNLALGLAAAGRKVALADLDVVNPYFRSREVRAPLTARGVRVLAPPPEASFVDLPVVAPGITALLSGPGPAILDAGGDAPGARVLRTIAHLLRPSAHDILFVVNACRPYAADPETAFSALRAWEGLAGLAVTGIVANAHLLDETTEETVRHGTHVAGETAVRAGVRLAFVGVSAALAAAVEGRLEAPVLPIERMLLPPHLRRKRCHG